MQSQLALDFILLQMNVCSGRVALWNVESVRLKHSHPKDYSNDVTDILSMAV